MAVLPFWDQILLFLWKNVKVAMRKPLFFVLEILIPILVLMLVLPIKSSLYSNNDPKKPSISLMEAYDGTLVRNYPVVQTEKGFAFSPDTDLARNIMNDMITDFNGLMPNEGPLAKQYTKETLIGFKTEEEVKLFVASQTKSIGIAMNFGDKTTSEFSYNIYVPERPSNTSSKLNDNFNEDFESNGQIDTGIDTSAGADWYTDKLYTDSPFADLYWINDNVYMYSGVMGIMMKLNSYIYQIKTNESFKDSINLLPVKIPLTQGNVKGFMNVLFLYGYAIMMTLAFVYPATMLTSDMVREKQDRLKETMKLMGASSLAYHLAWMIKGLVVFFIALLVVIIGVAASGFFNYVHISLFILLLILHSIAMLVFCLFMASIFHTVKLATIVTIIVYILSIVPYAAMIPIMHKAEKWQVILSCLSLNSCFGHAAMSLSEFETMQVSMGWGQMFTKSAPTVNSTFGIALVGMVINIVVFSLLTFYIENVFPGKYGVAKPWHFIITDILPKTWYNPNKEVIISVEDDYLVSSKGDLKMRNGTTSFEVDPDNLVATVKIKGLTKVYNNGKLALNNFNLNLYNGQITCLLGHNGSGKSTIMSLLCGFYEPTKGTAVIGNNDIRSNISAVRKDIGFCPQHNVLFTSLSVYEQMYFFGRLKGVEPKQLDAEIMNLLIDLNLSDKRNAIPSTLSGGMKRKFCVGISFIGMPNLVILDEPTAAMDVHARRAIWDLISKYRENRTILLTTHFMDEANILGNRIAILQDGELRACGTPSFLKRHVGVGYQIIFLTNPNFNPTLLNQLILEHVPDAKLYHHVGMELVYQSSLESQSQFPNLFRAIDAPENKNRLNIDSYGVSCTTMEEVFIYFARTKANNSSLSSAPGAYVKSSDITRHGVETDYNHIAEDTEASLESNGTDDEFTNQPISYASQIPIKYGHDLNGRAPILLIWQQFRAIMWKRYLIGRRNYIIMMAQLAVPMAFIFGGFLMTFLMTRDSGKVKSKDQYQVNFNYDYFKKKSNDNSSTYKTMYSTDSTLTNPYLKTLHNGLLSRDASIHNNYGENPLLMTLEKTIQAKSAAAYSTDPLNSLYMIGGYQLSEKEVSYELEYYTHLHSLENIDIYENYQFEFDYSPSQSPGVVILSSIYSQHALPVLLNELFVTLIREKTGESNFNINANMEPLTKGESVSKSASESNNMTIIFMDMISIFLSIIGFSLLTPAYILFLIDERTSGNLHIQSLSGLNTAVYWVSMYLYDFSIHVAFSIVAFLIVVIFGAAPYTKPNNSMIATLLLFIGYGFGQIPFLYIVQKMFHSSFRFYALTGIATVLSSLIPCAIIEILYTTADEKPFQGQTATPKEKHGVIQTLYQLFFILPPFSLGSGMLDLLRNWRMVADCLADVIDQHSKGNMSINNSDCYDGKYNDYYKSISVDKTKFRSDYSYLQSNLLDMQTPAVGRTILALYIAGIVYFTLLMIYEMGVGEMIKNLYYAQFHQESVTPSQSSDIDTDVAAEAERISLLPPYGSDEDQLLIRGMSKKFGNFTAVNNLNIGMKAGECFGLLGTNGAGKSTTFKVITGEIKPTDGDAFLDNFSLSQNFGKIKNRIGYAPQHNALLKLMTGKEVLEYYAMLRGYAADDAKKLVRLLLTHIDLNKFKNYNCDTYSGGNKRKLQTAIALLGNPRVICLDEPTAGVDPSTRRFLWNIITDLVKQGQLVVFTSHSLEECEALCTRLVIMMKGSCKCIGSIQHLKQKFGNQLFITFRHQLSSNSGIHVDDDIPDVDKTMESSIIKVDQLMGDKLRDSILKTFPMAVERTAYQGTYTYTIPTSYLDQLNWSEIFDKIINISRYCGIEDYSISQSTLEQIFLELTNENELSEDCAKALN